MHPRRHRARRIFGAAIPVCAAVAVVWLAAARWHGAPALRSHGATYISRIPIDPLTDRTEGLLSALNSLPPEPTWSLPEPPPGKKWAGTPSGPINPSRICDGPWSPETRPHMRAVIAFLESPEVKAALSRFAALSPGGCRLSSQRAADLRRAVDLLVARSRYQHTGRGDVDAAIDILLSVLRLSGICCNSGDRLLIMVGIGCEQLAVQEMQVMCFEHPLSRVQAARILEAMAGGEASGETLWMRMVQVHVAMWRHALDCTYTLDSDGNGWLALSHLDSMVWDVRQASVVRCGAWNLFSTIFNSRRTVAAKIDDMEAVLVEIDNEPYDVGQARLMAVEAQQPLNWLDGPIWYLSIAGRMESEHRWYYRLRADRQAAIAAVALSAYRHEHGNYPDSLHDLVDSYLHDVPLDPLDGQPIRYAPTKTGDDFVLYSVGADLVDNGGRFRRMTEPASTSDEGRDVVFEHVRSAQLWSEIELEDIES